MEPGSSDQSGGWLERVYRVCLRGYPQAILAGLHIRVDGLKEKEEAAAQKLQQLKSQDRDLQRNYQTYSSAKQAWETNNKCSPP